VLGALCLVPGLPKLAFLVPAVILAGIGRTVTKEQPAEEAAEEAGKKADPSRADNLDSVLKVDDLSLEIGFQLIPLVDEAQGGLMLSRVRTLRRHLAGELGFLVPAVHISDNLRLKPREYVVSLRGLEIGRWQTEANQLLAVSNEARPRPMQGKEVREPAFGANARWIAPELEEQALAAGYSVVDPATAISTHLAELIRTHAHELLSRAETKRLLDTLNESHPKLVEELVPKVMSLGEVQKVLQQLLREQVSIRDLGTILETLVEVAAQGRGLPAMVEAVRRALGRRLTQKLLDSDGSLPVMVLEPALEEALIAATQSEPPTDALLDRRTPASAQLFARISESLKKLSQNHPSSALPVLLCQSPARYYLRRWLEPVFPRITVLAPPEIGPEIRVHSIGVLRG